MRVRIELCPLSNISSNSLASPTTKSPASETAKEEDKVKEAREDDTSAINEKLLSGTKRTGEAGHAFLKNAPLQSHFNCNIRVRHLSSDEVEAYVPDLLNAILRQSEELRGKSIDVFTDRTPSGRCCLFAVGHLPPPPSSQLSLPAWIALQSVTTPSDCLAPHGSIRLFLQEIDMVFASKHGGGVGDAFPVAQRSSTEQKGKKDESQPPALTNSTSISPPEVVENSGTDRCGKTRERVENAGAGDDGQCEDPLTSPDQRDPSSEAPPNGRRGRCATIGDWRRKIEAIRHLQSTCGGRLAELCKRISWSQPRLSEAMKYLASAKDLSRDESLSETVREEFKTLLEDDNTHIKRIKKAVDIHRTEQSSSSNGSKDTPTIAVTALSSAVATQVAAAAVVRANPSTLQRRVGEQVSPLDTSPPKGGKEVESKGVESESPAQAVAPSANPRAKLEAEAPRFLACPSPQPTFQQFSPQTESFDVHPSGSALPNGWTYPSWAIQAPPPIINPYQGAPVMYQQAQAGASAGQIAGPQHLPPPQAGAFLYFANDDMSRSMSMATAPTSFPYYTYSSAQQPQQQQHQQQHGARQMIPSPYPEAGFAPHGSHGQSIHRYPPAAHGLSSHQTMCPVHLVDSHPARAPAYAWQPQPGSLSRDSAHMAGQAAGGDANGGGMSQADPSSPPRPYAPVHQGAVYLQWPQQPCPQG